MFYTKIGPKKIQKFPLKTAQLLMRPKFFVYFLEKILSSVDGHYKT
jgi:hypothetical protein